MDYIGLCFRDIDEAKSAILIFRLSEEGFESFEEKDNELWAFIPESFYFPEEVQRILDQSGVEAAVTRFPEQNWNQQWEKNFESVEISGICRVRAPFHKPENGWKYEIIIEPKMSFGTAHHETTALMIELMLGTDFTGKKVLDMGCGTGILAILADKMDAGKIIAVDNDEWAFNNAVENVRKNNAGKTSVIFGELKDIREDGLDVILANITRNIILGQLDDYYNLMKEHGLLLVSGFYETDFELIRDEALIPGFRLIEFRVKNNWIAAKFGK
jgi:ribosomal protein L11 methyltransferase